MSPMENSSISQVLGGVPVWALLLIAAPVVLLLIQLVRKKRQEQGHGHDYMSLGGLISRRGPVQAAPAPEGSPGPVHVGSMREVQEALERGEIIEAVRLAREATGLDLASSKALVDALRQNPMGSMGGAQVQTTVQVAQKTLGGEDVQQVVSLIRSGKKIEAIKLVRESTGLGLKEAKDVVDGMEQALLR